MLNPKIQFDTASLAQFLVFESAAAVLDKSDGSISNLVSAVSTIESAIFSRGDPQYGLFCWSNRSDQMSGGLYIAGEPQIEKMALGNVLPLGEVLVGIAKDIQKSR